MATEVDIMPRWGFLEPWLGVLSRQYINGMGRWQQSPFEPVQLYVFITFPAVQEEAKMMLEGLKLLAAVAFVDYNVWKKLLLGLHGMRLSEHWEEDTDNEIIVRFQLTIGMNDGGTVDNLVQMCGVHQHDHPRREYSEGLARIAAMDVKYDGKKRGVEIPVPVVAFFTKDVSSRELLKLRNAMRTWESSSLPPVQPGGLRCTFVLSGVNADLEDYFLGSIGLDVATKMHQLLYDNVWFSHISLRLELGHKVARLRKEVHGLLLTSFIGSTRRSNDSSFQLWKADNDTSIIHQQLDHLCLEPAGQTRNDMEAIFLAVIQSQTVRELEFVYAADSSDSVHWWQWIAYAFFSKRAQTFSSLEGLALKGIEKMTATEIEAFCGILASENPEEELIGSGLKEATLSANSPIRWDFDEFGKSVLGSGVVQFPSPIPFVWIMNSSEQTEWVDALVPGYGRCQVLHQNLIFNDPVDRTIRGNDLTALEIHFYSNSIGRDLSGLPPFFAAIGSTLKTLTIDAKNEDMDMEMLLERCPNLEKLCLMKSLNSAIFSFSEYRATGSPVPVFPFRFDDTFALTEELTNPDSHLTKCLKRLTIHPFVGPDFQGEGTYKSELDALLKMLENNGRLEYLHISLVKTGSYVERFEKFHWQPIDRSIKLDTQSKIAFLSVLSTTNLPQSEKRRNWNHFDANAVTNIFQFAAAPFLRKVYVESDI